MEMQDRLQDEIQTRLPRHSMCPLDMPSARFPKVSVGPVISFALIALLVSASTLTLHADDNLAADGIRSIRAIESALKGAIEKAEPSVVAIFLSSSSTGDDLVNRQFNIRRSAPSDREPPESYLYAPSAFGSGIVVDSSGLILTCYHVVRGVRDDSQRRIDVALHDGRRFTAKIHAADPRSDLAMLKLEMGNDTRRPKAIEYSDYTKITRGQFVLTLGNPFGLAAPDGLSSASWGIISNIRRRSALPIGALSSEKDIPLSAFRTLVETDARLNTGISGGALIDIEGRLVGITMALSATSGIETPGGFAFPVDPLFRRIVAALKEGREVEYGFLGVTPTHLTEDEMQNPLFANGGAKVTSVLQYVPATNSLYPQDVIVNVSGKPVRNTSDLMLAVGGLPAGTIVDMVVVRGGEKQNVKVELAKFPVVGEIIVSTKRESWNGIRVEYMSAIAPRNQFFDFPRHALDYSGVLVKEVDTGSVAEAKGIRPNSIITHVNGLAVTNPKDFERIVQQARGQVRIRISGQRDEPEIIFDPPAKKKEPTKR